MSTVFVLVKKGVEIKLDKNGMLGDEICEEEYVEIAYRNSSGITFRTSHINIIISHFPNKTKVYPIDNTPQGIYTVGDIRKEMGIYEPGLSDFI